MLRRLVTWLLVACFVLMGTGSIQALHHWQHALEYHDAGQGVPHHDGSNDESKCPLCVKLHQPLQRATLAPLTLTLGLALDLAAVAPIACRAAATPLRIDCRGPPAMLVVLD